MTKIETWSIWLWFPRCYCLITYVVRVWGNSFIKRRENFTFFTRKSNQRCKSSTRWQHWRGVWRIPRMTEKSILVNRWRRLFQQFLEIVDVNHSLPNQIPLKRKKIKFPDSIKTNRTGHNIYWKVSRAYFNFLKFYCGFTFKLVFYLEVIL